MQGSAGDGFVKIEIEVEEAVCQGMQNGFGSWPQRLTNEYREERLNGNIIYYWFN